MPRPDMLAVHRQLWARHVTEADPERLAALGSILRTSEIVLRGLDAACKPHGITYPQLEYLSVLFYSEDGRLPMGKIAKRLYVTHGNVTQTTNRLVRTGFVEKCPSPDDKRMTVAELTEAGRAAVKEALFAIADSRFGLEAISPSEAETLSAVLRKVRLHAGDFDE